MQINSSREIKTEGVVLRIQNYKESSRIFELLSPLYGKISIIAQRVRGKKSKYLGIIEPFNYIEVIIHHTENSSLKVLKSTSFKQKLIEPENYDRVIAASAGSELILKIETHEETELIYNTFIQYLAYISKIQQNYILIFWRFSFKIFELIGIPFNLTECVLCEQKINTPQSYFPQRYGFICEECEHLNNNDELIALNDEAKFILKNFSKIGRFRENLKINSRTKEIINEIIELSFYIQYNMNLKLNSLRFL